MDPFCLAIPLGKCLKQKNMLVESRPKTSNNYLGISWLMFTIDEIPSETCQTCSNPCCFWDPCSGATLEASSASISWAEVGPKKQLVMLRICILEYIYIIHNSYVYIYILTVYIYTYTVYTFCELYSFLQPSVYFWICFGWYSIILAQSHVKESECWGIIDIYAQRKQLPTWRIWCAWQRLHIR